LALLKNLNAAFLLTTYCYPQIVNLDENAGLQTVFNDVIFSIIMIWITCFIRDQGQQIHSRNSVAPPGNQAANGENKSTQLKKIIQIKGVDKK
jgi:hypothetical protein